MAFDWLQNLVGFFAQYLENDWKEFNQILYTHYHCKIYFGIVKHHFSQICNRLTALDWCRNFGFAQYHENISIHVIIDKVYVGIVKRHFCKFATELPPLADVRISFWMRMNRNIQPNCIHISIDKICIGIIKRHFSQICKRVTHLIDIRIWLENEWTEFNKTLVYTLSLIRSPLGLRHQFATDLWLLIFCIQKVFAQNLENEWTDFNQLLYAHYNWQDLRMNCYYIP